MAVAARRHLLRSAAVAGALGASARLAAATAGLLLAYRFGAGAETDAYLLAKTIPLGLYLMLDSVLYNALVPILRRTPSPAPLFRASLALATVAAAVLTAAVWLGAHPLIALLAPGAGDTIQQHAAALQRLTAWAVLLAVPASCLKAWNASHDRYVAASLDGCAISGLLLATLWLLPEDGGIGPVALALPAAFLLLLGVQSWLARRALGVARRLPLADYPWHTFRRPVGPLLALNAAQQAQVWAAVMLAAGFAAGSVSQVHYSYGIAQIPVGIIDLILFSTLFPFAAGLAARKDHARLARSCRAAAIALLLVCVPLALWLALARELIVEALLLRGVFDQHDGRMTAALLLGHAAAIPGWCLEALGCRYLFALERHGRYLGVVLFRVAAFLGLSGLLLPALGLPGLSVAFAGAFTASALLAMALVRRELSPAGRQPAGALAWPAGMLLGGSLAVLAAYLFGRFILEQLAIANALIHLGVHAILAGCVLGGMVWALHRRNYFDIGAERESPAPTGGSS